jgi:hypothetical protein
MGERLTVTPGTDLVVGIVVRDPAGTSNSPYSFPNPSLAQVSINQPMNAPVLDHIDLIGGLVTGLVAPGTAAYSGAWPDKWVSTTTGAVQPVSAAPVAARNTSTVVTRTFSAASGLGQWSTVSASGADYLAMTYTITGATASQYVRLRGTNLPAAVPFETDSAGNPLPDVFTNAGTSALLRIPCKTVGTNVPALGSRLPYTGNTIDGCPSHLPTATIAAVLDGNGNVITPAYTGKVVAYDVAAWADLWFYSNPIYVQVQ